MGGAQKAKVLLRLDGSGELVRIGSNEGYLREQPKNRLYHKALVRVEADQHHRSGQLRNLRLIAFEDYQPGYDDEALDSFIAAGAAAWTDVPDAAQWVRELRGGQG